MIFTYKMKARYMLQCIWNALNNTNVSLVEFMVISRYITSAYFNKSWYIPRVMDTDTPRRKRAKRIIVKYLAPFIGGDVTDGSSILIPNIAKVTNSKVYFNFYSRSTNDKDRLIKILLTQALSIGGNEIIENIKLDLSSNMLRFNIHDAYGSSEVVFEDVGILAEIKNGLGEITKASFNGDMDILSAMEEEEKVVSAQFEAKFVLGIHVVNMDNNFVHRYKTKEDILTERFAHFVRQLDMCLPYGKYRSSINWDNLTKKDYLNIVS